MKFSKAEIKFIRETLRVEAKEDEGRENVLLQIQDLAFELEAAESNKQENLSEHGKMAAKLVTALGE